MGSNLLTGTTDLLYEELKRLRDAEGDDIQREVERAKAMENVAAGIRSNIGAAISIEKFRADYGVEPRMLPHG